MSELKKAMATLAEYVASERMDVPDSVRIAARVYALACRNANERLVACNQLLQSGQRSEALRQGQLEPDLLMLCADLEFPGRQLWEEIAGLVGLAVPQRVNARLVQNLTRAFTESQPTSNKPPQPRRTAPRPVFRPSPNVPEPAEVNVVEDEPGPPPPPLPLQHEGSRVLPLLLGIVLGGLLFLICASLVEIATERSLLRHAGVKGRDEVEGRIEFVQNIGERETKSNNRESNKPEGQWNAVAFDALRIEKQKWSSERTSLISRAEAAESERDMAKKEADNAKRQALAAREKLEAIAKDAGEDPAIPILTGRVKKLEGQLKEANKTIAQVQGKPAPAPAVVWFDMNKLVLKPPPFELFRANIGPNSRGKLTVHGVTSDIQVTSENNGQIAIMKDRAGFKAILSIDKGAVSVTSGTELDKHRLLGLAVIELSTEDGNLPVYRQLFRPKDRPAGGIFATKDKVENGSRFTFNPIEFLDNPVKQEVLGGIKDGKMGFGRTARVRLGLDEKKDSDVDLEPPADQALGAGPLTLLKNRFQDGNGITVTMRLSEGETVVIEVDPPVKSCEIRAIEVGRVVESLPGYFQELFRVR